MIFFADSQSGSSVRTLVALGVVLVLTGAAAWLFSSRGSSEKAQAAVICAACGQPGSVEVGDTASLEEWPRPCPKCGKRQVYLGQKCRYCDKPVPMKDPAADKYGQPTECPWCKKPFREL